MTEDLSEESLHALLHKEYKEIARAIRKAYKAQRCGDITRINVEEYLEKSEDKKTKFETFNSILMQC